MKKYEYQTGTQWIEIQKSSISYNWLLLSEFVKATYCEHINNDHTKRLSLYAEEEKI
jgi:hypothetical protein